MTAIVKKEGENLHDGKYVMDLVFLREGVSDESSSGLATGIKPWKTSFKTESWPKDWILDEFDFPCRVFEASYYLTPECWKDRFPLLECSKIILHQLRKHNVGDANHFSFFFAWSLDSLILKQIVHTALLDEPQLFSTIKGMVFFSCPHRMSNLNRFTEMIEVCAKDHNYCTGTELRNHIPYLQGLNQTFLDIAQSNSISCISFSTHEGDPALRGLELLGDLQYGSHFTCPMKTHRTVTNFETREEISYLRLVQYLNTNYQNVSNQIEERAKKEVALRQEREKSKGYWDEFTVAIRTRSVVLALGEHSSEEEFQALKRDPRREEHPQVIERIKEPSLFSSLQIILRKLATFQVIDAAEEKALRTLKPSEQAKKREEIQLKMLQSALQDGTITVHVVGDFRRVSVSIIFVCLTFNFEIKLTKHEVRIPKAFAVSEVEACPCRYDMDVVLRHTRTVQGLLDKWNDLNRWGVQLQKEGEKLMRELETFAHEPLKIAIVGKSNVGKSTFLNAMLQRNVLPESHEACTGCVLEIRYAETEEEETVALRFISKRELDVITKRYKSEVLAPDQAEYNELTGEREHWNPERVAALKKKIEHHKKFLKDISTEYHAIVKKHPNLTQVWDKQVPMQQFISDTAVNTSKARSRLIKSAHLYLHNPLLRSVTLVDTPGIGEDKLKGRDHLTEQAVRAADVHGWIYLTVVMDMEKNFREDLKLLSEWSPNGIVCVTKFDQLCTPGGSNVPLHQKLSGKINALKDDVIQRQIPAVSTLALYQVTTNFPKKSQAGLRAVDQLGVEVNRLIKAHVGDYLYNSIPGGGVEDVDEFDFDENNEVSLARCCFDLSRRDWDDFHRLLSDVAVESSLLMVLMHLVYNLIDQRFVVKRFDQVLSDITTYLSRRMVLLTDNIQQTQDELNHLQSVEDELNQTKFQMSLNELDQQIITCFQVRKQLEDDCFSRETDLEGMVFAMGNEICQKIASRFTTKSSAKNTGVIDKLKRFLSKPPEHLSLYRELDKVLAADVNSYLTNTMLCIPTVETLITKEFDSIKHNILLQVDRASMSINCLREANSEISLADRVDLLDTSCKEAQENFHGYLMDHARQNIKLIAVNARAHLNNVHCMIIAMVDKEISHLQNRLLAKRMSLQQEHVTIRKPVDVLQVSLDKYQREFHQLRQLYGHVLSISLQNTIKSNKIQSVIQSRSTLSKPEQDYVDRVMKLYLEDTMDEEDNSNVTLLDTFLSVEALAKYISGKYGKHFDVISVKDYFQIKPDRVLVRNRRTLSVFMQPMGMMITQVSLDGSQFHTEKDLQEIFASIDCRILCEPSKLEETN